MIDSASSPQPSAKHVRKKRRLSPNLLVLLTLLVVLGSTLYPATDGVRLAFTNASLLMSGTSQYAGENFTQLFSSDIFWHSIVLIVAVSL